MARNFNDYRGQTGTGPWRMQGSNDQVGRDDPGMMNDYGSTNVASGQGYWTSGSQSEENRYDRSEYGGGRDYMSDEGRGPGRRYRDDERGYRSRIINTQDYGGRSDDGERYAPYNDRGYGYRGEIGYGERFPSGGRRNQPGDRYLGDYGADYGYTGYGHGYGLSERRFEPDQRRMDHRSRRDFWNRAGDEVASWFGDDEAQRRRDMDKMHRGRGPKNYTRSSDRIREDVCDRLADDGMVDASNIEVNVTGTEVTLTGTVTSRDQRRRAEDVSEDISGVSHVQNNLRVSDTSGSVTAKSGSTMSGEATKPV